MSDGSLTHPTPEVLQALFLGQLSQPEAARVSAHLCDCNACCVLLDQMAAEDPLVARLKASAARPEETLVTRSLRRSAIRGLRNADRAISSTCHGELETVAIVVPTPKHVGDYDILAEVGRGGMGVVYKARHRRLHRLAALKMVLAGEFASPIQERRFHLEAELAARLQHPNIVQLYEIGTHEGRPFLALEWVEGGSLANLLDGTPWLPAEAAAIIETLARAIHVAHCEGVVHRDLKPANILWQVVRPRRKIASSPRSRRSSYVAPHITPRSLTSAWLSRSKAVKP
jgi:hypothetical protein